MAHQWSMDCKLRNTRRILYTAAYIMKLKKITGNPGWHIYMRIYIHIIC